MTLGDVLDLAAGGKVDRRRVEEIGLMTETSLRLKWNTASGGERQKTLITRALMCNPTMLIMDEPFNHLDPESKPAFCQVITRFLAGSPPLRAVILVSHDDAVDWGRVGLSPRYLELRLP